MSTRVYKFGLLAPTDNEALVRDQMFRAHRYANTLTEIERGRRAALREIAATDMDGAALMEGVVAADLELGNALQAVRLARAESRQRLETNEMRQRVRLARDARREAVAALRERRRQMRDDDALAAARSAVEERAGELRRSARAHCGVYWGTYLLIEDADQASRKMPLYDGAEPNDPRFERWAGEGRVGVQLQGGMAVAELFGGDTRLHIDAVDERAWHSTVRAERRRYSRTTLRLRVGSEGRDPIWAAWPMLMHRELPEGSTVKRAVVNLRRIGPREEWSCDLTIDTTEVKATQTCGKGAVAIDLGWRVMGEDLRVAMWQGTDGAQGELRLPGALLSALKKSETLRGTRDKNFDAARASLAAWPAQNAPEWFVLATRTLAHWRSAGRLVALCRRWRDARFEGDASAYDALEAWRYHDQHLWEWECSQRIKALRRRREKYRVFAASLAARYETVVLEAFDLRRVARRAPTERDKADNHTAASNRQLAAVSELRDALRNAFEARGGAQHPVDASDSTHACHVCGVIEAFDAAVMIHHACATCGAIWDQDENAAIVLLERWRVAQNAGAARNGKNLNALAGPSESRWARAKRMATEKQARKSAARKSDDSVAE